MATYGAMCSCPFIKFKYCTKLCGQLHIACVMPRFYLKNMDATTEFNNIFDAFMEADKIRQVKLKIRETIAHRDDISQKCGSCYYWMTQQCKREQNHKVSCNERKCDDFKLGVGYDKIIEKDNTLIAELTASLNGA